LFVNDTTEIGTSECHLSSDLYGNALNKAKGYGLVCVALNLWISRREEVGFAGLLRSQRYALLGGGRH